MSVFSQLPVVEVAPRLSVADQIFDSLQQQIMSLDLPPGTKMSEAEVAKHMGVSRQPVRDAFYRLGKLGFLSIRPQRATTVTKISAAAVLRARFIRASLEVEAMRVAAKVLTQEDLLALRDIMDRQQAAIAAGDRVGFHALDDLFHKEMAERAGLGFAWEIIRENKAHMDRVRFLSLSFASQVAFDEHTAIFDALAAGDGDAAANAMRGHLSRILDLIDRIRAANHDWFEDEDAMSP